MRKAVKIGLAVLVVQAVFVAVWWYGRSEEPDQRRAPNVVQVVSATELDGPAPDLRYITVDGGEGTLADHRGRPVVVHFWATWCPPCVDELPRLLEWSRSGEIVLLAVSLGDGRAKLRAFFDDAVPDEVVIPVGAHDELFSPTRLPVTFLVDADGNLVRRWNGAREWTESDRKTFTAP